MGFDINKRDFEKALSELDGESGRWSGVISRDVLKLIEKVVDEYNHFQSDIEEMYEQVESAEELESERDELGERCEDYEAECSLLNDNVEELNDRIQELEQMLSEK